MSKHIENLAEAAARSVVIFAIDRGSDPRIRARFERHVDTLRAMGVLKRPVRLCVGMWEGVMEASYEMDAEDLEKVSDWVKGQDALLFVSAGKVASLRYGNGAVEVIGEWQKVSATEAMRHPGWTYYLDANEYWVAA